MWARAMYKYYQVALMVEPKKKLLAEAEESLKATMIVLENAQSQLQAAEAKIHELGPYICNYLNEYSTSVYIHIYSRLLYILIILFDIIIYL